MGLLENAAEWLESQRIRELSVPIVYQRRDGETLNIPATLGRTLFRAENEYGVTIRTETRDFLIAAEDLPRVFEKGYTGCNGRTDKKSTGIGLYLCRKILDKLGHGITIESKIGAGTKVKVYLGDE